ncbi:hypothetical protein GGR51DRAFT_566921 [Nemania sp. FL0031]|nr:hypothetical protein GGR51DRAFT_566921 [Nemania sp. FL0031]
MAIIDTLPGLKVTVEVADKPLREFNVPYSSNDTRQPPVLKSRTKNRNHFGYPHIRNGYVAKYIEVESGTYPCVQFIKGLDFLYEGHHIAYSVEFDNETLLLRHQPPNLTYESWEDGVDSVVVGTEREQKAKLFRFANLTCISNAEYHNDTGYALARNVGSIRVCVYHMQSHRRTTNGKYDYGGATVENVMAETAIKGRSYSHCLEVVDGEKISDPEYEYEDDFLDDEKLPSAVFDFFYRSRKSLIELGVRTEREVEEDDERCMNADQLRAKLRRLREERERDNDEDQRLVKAIKHEPAESKIMTQGRIVIDLTGSP